MQYKISIDDATRLTPMNLQDLKKMSDGDDFYIIQQDIQISF